MSPSRNSSDDGGRASAESDRDIEIEVEVPDTTDASDEEVAAIVAAVEVAWPRPVVPSTLDRPPRWRFSGRWWSKPVPLRRSRPW